MSHTVPKVGYLGWAACQPARRSAWPAAVLALLLAGCSQVPPYERPALDVPAAYKQGVEGASVWLPAQPNPHAVPDAWWTLYGDAVLDRLQQQALEANPGLAQSVARLRAAQAEVDSSRDGLWPTLGASAGASRSGVGASAGGASGAATSYNLGLNASWELDLWGRVSAEVAAARATAQASADDLAAARLSLQATLAQSYFALRAAEAQAQLLRETLETFERSWTLTRNRYAAGVASSADVDQAETQVQTTRVQLLEAETSRAQWEHALAALVGQAPAAFALDATAALPAPPPVPAQLPARLLERRPDIAAAERRVAAANAQVGVAQAAYFPSISLSASGGYRGASLDGLLAAPHRVWALGPALALSLFDGGARSAGVAAAQASLDLAAASYRQTVLTALQEVEDNLVAGVALEREQDLQLRAVAAAERALAVVNNQYRAGTVAYLNVLVAQATVLSARRNLIDVRNRRLLAVNNLLKNLAGRWAPLDERGVPATATQEGQK